jgi:microcystin-dependent protein
MIKGASEMSDPFFAEVKIFAGNFAPRGCAFCNGQLLPIAQNTALFSIIGTNYGGDGRTTTALPNMQGRVPMHPGLGLIIESILRTPAVPYSRLWSYPRTSSD